jgi:signal transduction histidine kinase
MRRVTLRTQPADRLPRIEGDKLQLQQVMLNLILNAIQAMAEPRDSIRELHITTENVSKLQLLLASRHRVMQTRALALDLQPRDDRYTVS